MYFVIVEPPLSGATQETETYVPEIAVAGAAGDAGCTMRLSIEIFKFFSRKTVG